jgi:nicotinamide riboside kinase
MKKAVICLYGGPGAGKSTTAAYLFALCKIRAMNVELVREYIKDWVWEGRTITPGDQLYIFAKQSRKERILFKDTDLIITDSPIWLSPIYERKYDVEPFVTEIAIEKQLGVAAKAGFRYMHFILNRKAPYQQEGRYHTEEEAKSLDTEIRELLTRKQMPFWEIDGNEEAAQNILNILDKELV